MFPFVPSGSVLELSPLRSGESAAADAVHFHCAASAPAVSVGDIVAFVGGSGVVAHRVVALEGSVDGPRIMLRGDAQDNCVCVDAEALAYRVEQVCYRGFSYATSGRVGRALSHLAVERTRLFACARVLGTQLLVLHRYWRRLQAQSR